MKKLISLFAAVIALCLTLNGCSVVVKVTNPIEDIYIISATERLYLGEMPRTTGRDALTVSLAKNEAEGAQFVVRSEKNEYTNMSISVSDLVSEEQNTITADKIDLYREWFTVSSERWGQAPMTGEKYDELNPTAHPLITMAYPEYNTVNTKKGENTIYYLDVNTTADTVAGKYSGIVTLTHDGGKFEIPLNVTVWDVTMPEIPTYRTLFNYSGGFLKSYLNSMGRSDDYVQAIQNAFLLMEKFKLSSTTIEYPEVIGAWADLEGQIKNIADYISTHPTQNAFAGHLRYTTNGEEAFLSQSDIDWNLNYISLLEKYGILDNMYVYVVDEPGQKWQFNIMNAIGNFLKEYGLNEKVHNLVTKDSFESVKGSTNTWCPIVANFDPDYADSTRASDGSQYWWYFCNDPPAPGISIFADVSNTRMNGWMAKNWDIKGILYWAINLYANYYDETYDHKVSIWNYGWNDPLMLQGVEGDGIMNRNIAVPTLTMTAVRDSIEDYDLLIALEQKVSETITTLGLDMTLDEAMDGYYNSMYVSLKDFPTYEAPDNFAIMREHIFSDIVNGPSYLLTQRVVPSGGKYGDYKMTTEMTCYVPSGTSFSFESATFVSKTEKGSYDIYVYNYVNNAVSDTVTITVDGKEYKRPVVVTPTILSAELLVDLAREDALQLIKDANPKYADNIDIVKVGGVSTLKVHYTENMTSIILPSDIFEDLSAFGKTISFTTYIEGIATSSVYLSGSVGIAPVSGNTATIYEGKETVCEIPLSVPENAGQFNKFRLFLGKKADATVYLSNIYLLNKTAYHYEEEIKLK